LHPVRSRPDAGRAAGATCNCSPVLSAGLMRPAVAAVRKGVFRRFCCCRARPFPTMPQVSKRRARLRILHLYRRRNAAGVSRDGWIIAGGARSRTESRRSFSCPRWTWPGSAHAPAPRSPVDQAGPCAGRAVRRADGLVDERAMQTAPCHRRTGGPE